MGTPQVRQEIVIHRMATVDDETAGTPEPGRYAGYTWK
jgi:hypothetical protein